MRMLRLRRPESPQDASFRQMMDDLQVLIGRQDLAFVRDKIAEIRHRREWIAERDAFERRRNE